MGDEDVIRYMSFVKNLRKKFDPNNTELRDKYNKILHYLMHEKTKDDIDPEEILLIKGGIRREEALQLVM